MLARVLRRLVLRLAGAAGAARRSVSSDAHRLFRRAADRRTRAAGGSGADSSARSESRRDPAQPVHAWDGGLNADALDAESDRCRSLDEERVVLRAFIARTRDGGDVAGMTLAQFAGFGDGADRTSLSRRCYSGAEGPRIRCRGAAAPERPARPGNGAADAARAVREARSLHERGFTRAKRELRTCVHPEGATPRLSS